MKNKIMGSLICLLPLFVNSQSGVVVKSKIGPLCSASISWSEVLMEPSVREAWVTCLDKLQPLNTADINKNKLVGYLRQLKGKCALTGNMQIPEQLQVQREVHLSDEFIEYKLAQIPQYRDSQLEVKIVRRMPNTTSCDQIQMASIADIKIEGKNFFRWNLPTDTGSVAITGEFKLLKEVPVLKVGLGIGDRVSSEDWVTEKRDITFQSDVLLKAEDFEGRSLARGLVSGSVIRLADLKREFLVEKNQMVKVRMGGADFEISAMALAESSGYQGDWIKLKNPDSQKTFTGVAITKGVVEVR